jgi:hypothetical protein
MTRRTRSFLAPLLTALALAACASTDKDATPAPDRAYDYPVTLRPDVAGAEGVPERVAGDPLVHVGLWDRDGNELMSGMYDTSAGAFVEESVFLFGMLPAELEAQELGSIATRVDPEEAGFLLSCSDPEVRWLFLDAQGGGDDVSAGREQLLLAFGGIVALLRDREEHPAHAETGEDPCEPLEDKDYCTWSPEFFQQACCNHDECYAGCARTGTTRLACDQQFREDMRQEASVWTSPFVPAYYGAVRAFGAEFWPCG